MPPKSIHVAANGKISFFWWLSNSPLCVCVYIYIYIYTYTYHIFFIHSSVNGHLGSSHILATANSASMSIGVYVSDHNFNHNHPYPTTTY